MKIRNLIFATASAALAASPIAAQANTRAGSSSVAIPTAALGSADDAEVGVVGASRLTMVLLLLGAGGLMWALIQGTQGNRSPGANS